MHENLLKQLDLGINQLGLAVNATTQFSLLEFLLFLEKWNKAYNLTAIRSLDQMLTHHLLDSLSIAKYVQGECILDIGTGAGFPGVPLAFCYPDKKFVLLDSNGKKIRFLLQAKTSLKIDNIEPIQERVEKLLPNVKFDVIICRAVGEMGAIMEASKQLLTNQGYWLFMKGTYPQDELQTVTRPYQVHKLEVPGVDAARHVIKVENFPE